MAGSKLLYVKCCYCGSRQLSEPPPALATCFNCKREFRVLRCKSNVRPIELSAEAQKSISKRTVREG